ncbi:hypothetical protein ABZP36_013313 [Zizania latifolia]
MLKREVGEFKEVIEGKDFIIQSYKEQKLELCSNTRELQEKLDLSTTSQHLVEVVTWSRSVGFIFVQTIPKLGPLAMGLAIYAETKSP